jgi:hypothetical protein
MFVGVTVKKILWRAISNPLDLEKVSRICICLLGKTATNLGLNEVRLAKTRLNFRNSSLRRSVEDLPTADVCVYDSRCGPLAR